MSGQSGRSTRWVDVARFRKRDIRIILPLTAVAAAAMVPSAERVATAKDDGCHDVTITFQYRRFVTSRPVAKR